MFQVRKRPQDDTERSPRRTSVGADDDLVGRGAPSASPPKGGIGAMGPQRGSGRRHPRSELVAHSPLHARRALTRRQTPVVKQGPPPDHQTPRRYGDARGTRNAYPSPFGGFRRTDNVYPMYDALLLVNHLFRTLTLSCPSARVSCLHPSGEESVLRPTNRAVQRTAINWSRRRVGRLDASGTKIRAPVTWSTLAPCG